VGGKNNNNAGEIVSRGQQQVDGRKSCEPDAKRPDKGGETWHQARSNAKPQGKKVAACGSLDKGGGAASEENKSKISSGQIEHGWEKIPGGGGGLKESHCDGIKRR